MGELSHAGNATVPDDRLRRLGGFHDEAKHHGEMKLLLKLCRAGHAEA